MQSHAIDIPEMLIRIASHLEKPALAAGCRVCKAWLRPFTEQLWRSIDKVDFEGGRHHSLLRALPRHATFVRELACPSFLHREDLPLGPEFSRLTLFSASNVDREGVAWIRDILEHNPALENLSIESTYSIPETQAMDIVKTVTRLERLLSLRFETSWVVKETFLKTLLDGLPMLKSLAVRGDFEYTDIFPTLFDEEGASSDIQKQSYRLEIARLVIPWQLIHTAANLLASCPLLQHLDIRDSAQQVGPGIPDLGSFARLLHRSCPELSSLTIGSLWLDVNYLSYLLSLKSFMSNPGGQATWFRLRSLSIKNASAHNASILGIVWVGRGVLQDTLEDLEIDCNKSDPSGGMLVIMILENFRKLSRLSAEGVVVRAENFFKSDTRVEPWASIQIVSLSFTVRAPDWRSAYNRPWHFYIQAHLDSFPMLDQSGLRFLED